MKIHSLSILILVFLATGSCEISPQSHQLLYEEYDFYRILNTAEINISSTNHVAGDFSLNSLIEVNDTPPKTHLFKVEFRPINGDTALKFGEVQYQTKFKKYKLNNSEFWLPFSWKSIGFADSQKTSMAASPLFEFDFFSDSALRILQYSRITVCEKNAKVTFGSTKDESGQNKFVSVSTNGGATSSLPILNIFNSGNNGLVEVDFQGFGKGFENEGTAGIYRSIFGSRAKVIGKYQNGFLDKEKNVNPE